MKYITSKKEKKANPRKRKGFYDVGLFRKLQFPKVPNDMKPPYRSECNKHALTNLIISEFIITKIL